MPKPTKKPACTTAKKRQIKRQINVVIKWFHIKYTNESTNLFMYEQGEYKKYLGLLDQNLQYQTNTSKNAKTGEKTLLYGGE